MKKTFFVAGDTTPHRCGVCEKNLEITDIDTAEGLVWLACPDYTSGDDQHDSYSVPAVLEVVVEQNGLYSTSYIYNTSENVVLSVAKKEGIDVVEIRYGLGHRLHPDSYFTTLCEWLFHVKPIPN